MTQAITFCLNKHDIVFSGKLMAMNGVLKDDSLIMVSATHDGSGLTITCERASDEVIFSRTGSLLLDDSLSGNKCKEFYRCDLAEAESTMAEFHAHVQKLDFEISEDLGSWVNGCMLWLARESKEMREAQHQSSQVIRQVMAK